MKSVLFCLQKRIINSRNKDILRGFTNVTKEVLWFFEKEKKFVDGIL